MNIMIAGSSTDVGKTVVSAILVHLLKADYWKPVQCGDESSSDTKVMQELIDPLKHRLHAPIYSLKGPYSPHQAARLEQIAINPKMIRVPQSTQSIVIEGVGGILVPLTIKTCSLDLFKMWNCRWIVVSKHYLGSINHTLLTLEVLKKHQIRVQGLIFNGYPNQDSEKAILSISKLPFLARLLPEPIINYETVQRYAKEWRHNLKAF